MLDAVATYEPVDVAGICPAEDLVVELLHQGLISRRFSLAHHELPLSACS